MREIWNAESSQAYIYPVVRTCCEASLTCLDVLVHDYTKLIRQEALSIIFTAQRF